MAKKFKFRLQTLLKYREILKDTQEARLMQANRACQEVHEAIEALDHKQEEVYKQMIENAQTGFSLANHLSKETYSQMLIYEKSKEKSRLAKRLKALEFEQKRYVDYSKKHKSIEKLKTKAFDLYQKDLQEEENKLLDDLVNTRYRAQTEL